MEYRNAVAAEAVFAEWGVQRITVLIEVDRPWATEFWTAVGYPRDHHVVRHLGLLPSRSGSEGEPEQ